MATAASPRNARLAKSRRPGRVPGAAAHDRVCGELDPTWQEEEAIVLLKTWQVMAGAAILLLLVPPCVFVLHGLLAGMGLAGTLDALLEQYTVQRTNLAVTVTRFLRRRA